jgi:hypothetical protein
VEKLFQVLGISWSIRIRVYPIPGRKCRQNTDCHSLSMLLLWDKRVEEVCGEEWRLGKFEFSNMKTLFGN